MTSRSCSFQSGQNASSLHQLIQVYHNLLRWSLSFKSEEFTAFKGYKAWAERQLGTTLMCRWFNWRRIPVKWTKVIYGREWNRIPSVHARFSTTKQISTVKAKLHTYNVTLIKWTDYKTPKELWSGEKLNISHLQVFGCLAWVTF